MRGRGGGSLGLLLAFSLSLSSPLRQACRYSSPSSTLINYRIFSCSRDSSSWFSDWYTLSCRCCFTRSLGSLSYSQTEGPAYVLARILLRLLLLPLERLRRYLAERSVFIFPLHFLLMRSLRSWDLICRCLMMSSLQAPVCPSTTVAICSRRMFSMRFILSGESSSFNPRNLRQRYWWEMPSLHPTNCRCVSTKRSKSSHSEFTAFLLNNLSTRGSSKAGDNSNYLKYRMNMVRSNRYSNWLLCQKVWSLTHMAFRQKSNIISSFFSTRNLYAFHFYQNRFYYPSCLAAGSKEAERPFKRPITVPLSFWERAQDLSQLFLDKARGVSFRTPVWFLRMKSLMALSSSQTSGKSSRRQSFWSMCSSMWLYYPNSLPLRWSINWQN